MVKSVNSNGYALLALLCASHDTKALYFLEQIVYVPEIRPLGGAQIVVL